MSTAFKEILFVKIPCCNFHKIAAQNKSKEKELDDSDDDMPTGGTHKRLKEKHRKEVRTRNPGVECHMVQIM